MNEIFVFDFPSCLRPRELACNLQNNAYFIIPKNQDWLKISSVFREKVIKM